MVATQQGLDTLPDASRIWIYQADRKLTPQKCVIAEAEAARFVESWNAHGHQLKAGFELVHQQFLILAVDEAFHAPSGCSIDTSVALIRHLNTQFGVDFLNRRKVAIWENENVNVYDLSEIKTAVEQGKITQDSLVFNNLLQRLGEWRSNWKTPAGESWLKRYFG
jgi:hypothetical protein